MNDLQRSVETHLLGRRMYEVLRIWDVLPLEDKPREIVEHADLGRRVDKTVFSRTLDGVLSTTSIRMRYPPSSGTRTPTSQSSGPPSAASTLGAGRDVELVLMIVPTTVGDGTHWLPADLELLLSRPARDTARI